MEEERRRFPRLPIFVEVGGKQSDCPSVKAKSVDISEGGMRLLLPEEFPKGKVMYLEINFPFPSVVTRGKVVWTKEVEEKEGRLFQTGIEFY